LPRRGMAGQQFDASGRPLDDAYGRPLAPQSDAPGRAVDAQRELEKTESQRERERADARREAEKRDQERLRNDIKRYAAEINWDYAVIERLKQDDLTTTLVPFNLAKAVLEGEPSQNLVLQPGDVVTIFSKDDIQVPVSRRTQYVRLEGELRFPGLYQLQPGETLRQLVSRVGGLTSEAYLFGAELTRERTRVEQQKELDRLIEKMGQEFERAAGLRARSATSPEDAAGVKVQADSQRTLLERLRLLRATGRIVLEIPPGKNSISSLPDLVLEDGDRFLVSSQPSTVSVFGSVYVQNAFLYRSGKRIEDYLSQAGGITKDADEKSIYVVRADGSVVSRRQSSRFFSRFTSEPLMPNDAIVVPEDLERVSWAKILRDWSQIFSQFALGVAALKVLNNGL
jgi:polysaccharide export outer membrane protein